MLKKVWFPALTTLGLLAAGCGGGGSGGGGVVVPPPASQLYAINPDNQLSVMNRTTPGALVRQVDVTGLEGGAFLLSIDWDVKRKALLGLDDNFRIYSINTTTGAATKLFEPFDGFTPGDALQFEYDPVTSGYRVISQLRANGRIGADGVLIANDADLFYLSGDANEFENPNVTGFAFNNNVADSAGSTLFAIDASTDALVRLPTPNNGGCQTVGQLGIDLDLFTSFEILSGPASNTAFVTNNQSLDLGEFRSDLYTVNLTTGVATLVGTLPTGDVVLDMAISP
ncbi:MAG: DUF4394 domain-containing protein [Chthonomonas sp.]|nr:DUF4394 domain-containing protein [Chthonomonas sp.]